MYTHNGRTIQVGKSWVSDNGYTHAKNWQQSWGEADLERWSVTYSADPVVASPVDSRFYWDVDIPKSLVDVNEVDGEGEFLLDRDGNQVVTKGLKTIHIERKKTEANNLLHETDWYVVREAEGGSAVPEAIATARTAVRTACAGIETKITNCSDLATFIALFEPSEDEDGNYVKSDMDCY